MISNKVWDWNLIFIFFAVKTFCLLHNWKATFKASKIISSKGQTLHVNEDVLFILLRRSFKTCFARMSLHNTGLSKESYRKDKKILFFES